MHEVIRPAWPDRGDSGNVAATPISCQLHATPNSCPAGIWNDLTGFGDSGNVKQHQFHGNWVRHQFRPFRFRLEAMSLSTPSAALPSREWRQLTSSPRETRERGSPADSTDSQWPNTCRMTCRGTSSNSRCRSSGYSGRSWSGTVRLNRDCSTRGLTSPGRRGSGSAGPAGDSPVVPAAAAGCSVCSSSRRSSRASTIPPTPASTDAPRPRWRPNRCISLAGEMSAVAAIVCW